MDRCVRGRDHPGADLEDPIDRLVHRPFVARDRRRREDHRVARVQLDVSVVVERHPPQGREWLALAPGRDRDHLVVGKVLDLLRRDQQPVGSVGDPEVAGDVEVLAHRAANECDSPVERHAGVDHLLHAVDVGGEAGDDDPALAARELLQQRRPDGRLRGHDAGAVGVGRVAAKTQDPLRAELRQPRDVRRPTVDRRLIEAVVAGDQDRAEVGMQGDRPGVGDRVRHVDHLDLERARLDPLAELEHRQRRLAQLVLLELRAHQADRQRAAVDRRRHPDLAEHVGQRSDVVLVRVGEHDRLDLVGAAAQVVEVRQHEVDSEHLRCREHQPRVDDDDPPAALEHGHVLADLPQPAEGEDANRVAHARFPAPLVSRPCSVSARRIASRSSSDAGAIGSRTCAETTPSSSSAAFTATAGGATDIAL